MIDDEEFPNPFEDDEDQDISPAPQMSPTGEQLVKKTKLDDEMKAFIDKHWKDMDLMEMTRHIFMDDNLKGSSKEGRMVRKYLVSKGYDYKTTSRAVDKDIELTEEHKEFITKYASTMKPHEIARIIFKDEGLHHFSKEAIEVQQYIKSVSPTLLKKDDEYTDKDYEPPRTFKSCYKRIQELTGVESDEDKLNVRTRKQIDKCLEFLQAPRFVQTCNNLKNIAERSIFESEFIRSVWDKPDLTADEINLYISLINEYVIQDRLHRITSKLNVILEGITNDPEGKIAISLSEAIKGKSEELNQSLNRQLKYTNDLQGKRATRQEQQTARHKSLVSLVEAFRDEEERKNAIRFAELRKKKVKDEMERLEGEDEWNARIFGITKEEIEE